MTDKTQGRPRPGKVRRFASRWGHLICVSLLTIGASVMAIDSYGRLTILPVASAMRKPPPPIVDVPQCLDEEEALGGSCPHRSPAGSLRAVLEEGLASPLVDLRDHDQRRLFKEWSKQASRPGTSVVLFRRGAEAGGRQTYGLSFDGGEVVGDITVKQEGPIWRPVAVTRSTER